MVRDGESCLVSVVPIPYMELNSDGTVRAWHCDASKFPSYVPVVDWHTYDLAAHRPDIIFIHNPYDGINLVSRVAPQYYAAELKKYTSLLVYVPYFVSGPHVDPVFCRLPGVLYADRVIVESENIKQQYEQNYPGGNPPPGKFLALGSSKYDKVRSSRRADFFLPPDWRRLIKGRKVILYNLSIRDAMEQREQFIPNLRHVLILFQCQRELVLWWRPHPLLQAAFMAIHPSQGRAYCQLVRQYQDEGWGIYDDSPDLHRAIAWADLYYGGSGSLLHLYQATRKHYYTMSSPSLPVCADAVEFSLQLALLGSGGRNVALPKAWSRVLSGGQKCVLIYICPEDYQLGGFQFVEKMNRVLETFSQQADVLLWWHMPPKVRARLREASDTRLSAAFVALEERMLTFQWGIYDVSAGLQRAMAWTDAYYGDLDAAVWLYMVKQVPVLVQDMAVRLTASWRDGLLDFLRLVRGQETQETTKQLHFPVVGGTVLAESVAVVQRCRSCYLWQPVDSALAALPECKECQQGPQRGRATFPLPPAWQ